MDMFVIRGGTPLRGVAAVGGAKNAALPIMAAAILADGPLTLHGVPDLADVRTQRDVLSHLGLDVQPAGDRSLRLQVVDDRPCTAPYDLVRRMRASVCVLGPLLARRGRACVSLPGGCNIGHRPIDLHLRGLAALGADIRIENGYVLATARRLRGGDVDMAGPRGGTVTGTCNVLSAATLAHGVTTIRNAALEPEVGDLARCLVRMGARIDGVGTPTLTVEGVDALASAGYAVLPDRIEAATLMCAAVITRGCISIRGARPEHLGSVIETLHGLGAVVQVAADEISVRAEGELRPARLCAAPYPGLPTDVQAQLTAVLTQAQGVSRIADSVFPDRFMHVSELLRFGASIQREAGAAVVHGATPLSGAPVMACDLRASAALVLAGLAARGETVVRRIYHLDRGYERLELRLQALGADVVRASDGAPERSAPESTVALPAQAGPHFLQAPQGRRSRTSETG